MAALVVHTKYLLIFHTHRFMQCSDICYILYVILYVFFRASANWLIIWACVCLDMTAIDMCVYNVYIIKIIDIGSS